jgi:hypothetical protein
MACDVRHFCAGGTTQRYNVASMAEPLDYRNPKRSRERPEGRDGAAPTERRPRVAVPIEFDHLLSRTEDHPAARAIEAALRRERIAAFLTDDSAAINQIIDIYVYSADREAAEQIAGKIFARRSKLKKAFPKPQMPDIWPSQSIGPYFP